MRTETSSVLVIGGSLVGLSTAVFLAWHGVPVVLVERHLGSSTHPRAVGYTTRTLELFRAVGIELPTSAHGGPPRRARVHSLAGAWQEAQPWSPRADAVSPDDYSPVRATAIAQDSLEPILRDRAAQLGADLRLGTELVSFEHDDDGVVAVLRRRTDGHEYRLAADYLVAADGAGSPLRERLGIARSGKGLLSVQRSILFRAPLQEYLRAGVVQFEIDQPDFQAFLTTYSDGRWILMLGEDIDRTEEQQHAAIRRAVGRDDLPVELITSGRWELAAYIADHFSCGRVFLVGDAAHQLPPNRGGYGANTGIADAHNLSWKLAAVLAGTSRPELLDTYDSERRPVALLRHDQIFARADYKAHIDSSAADTEIIDDAAMELGQLYRSSALPEVSEASPPAQRPDEWAGQPGTRAPHFWLDEARRHSVLDEFGRSWVVLADRPDWGVAVQRSAESLSLPVEFVHIDTESPAHGDFVEAYGLGPGGAALVRPDGYLAWRSVTAPASRAEALTSALARAAMTVPRLERRLAELEDRAAIQELTARYADAVNQGWSGKRIAPESIPDLFTTDATFSDHDGVHTVGAAAIAAALPEATAAVSFAMHAFLNPVLTIDGDSADGSWLMWIASILDGEPRAVYLGAELQYRRTGAGWRIQSVDITPGMRLPAR